MIFLHLRSGHDKAAKLCESLQIKADKSEDKAHIEAERCKQLEARIASLQKESEGRIADYVDRLKKAREEGGGIAADVGWYFGAKAGVEMEDFANGNLTTWDLEAEKASLEKDFPKGCPHAEYIQGSLTCDETGDPEVTSRGNKDAEQDDA